MSRPASRSVSQRQLAGCRCSCEIFYGWTMSFSLTWSNVDDLYPLGLLQLPGEGVLSSTAPDDEDSESFSRRGRRVGHGCGIARGCRMRASTRARADVMDGRMAGFHEGRGVFEVVAVVGCWG